MTYDEAKTICLDSVEPRLGVVYQQKEGEARNTTPFYVESIADGFVSVRFVGTGNPAWSERIGSWTRRVRLGLYVQP